jgi:hypothetical protein
MLLCALREWDRRLDFICATEGKMSGKKKKFRSCKGVLAGIARYANKNKLEWVEHDTLLEHSLEFYWSEETVRKCVTFDVDLYMENCEEKGYKIRMLSEEWRKRIYSILYNNEGESVLHNKIAHLLGNIEKWKSTAKKSIAPADHDVPVALEAE